MLFNQSIDPNDPNQRRFVLLRWLANAWHWVLPPTQAHSDRESQTKRTARSVVIFVVGAGSIIGAVMFARPIQQSYKHWKADGYLTEAHKYVEKGDLYHAVDAAQHAFSAAPDYVPSIRLNAELLTEAKHNSAVVYWNLLEKQGAASFDDMRGKIRALHRVGQTRDARALWEQLVQAHPNDKALMVLAEELWGKQQVSGFILQFFKNYTVSHPEDRDNALRLARAQVHSGLPAEMTAGYESLWRLSAGTDEVSLTALRDLAERDKLDIAERNRLADALDAHPKANGWDHTSALTLRLALTPERRDDMIEVARKRWFAEAHGEALEPFVRWLVLNHEFNRVIGLIDVADIKKRKDCNGLLLNYLTALSMTGRIPQLETIVNDKDIPLTRAVRTFYQAHLAVIKGLSGDELKSRLRAAVSAAIDEGQHELLLQIGSYCIDKLHRYYDVARAAYEPVARAANPRTSRFGFAGWLKSCRLVGDTKAFSDAAILANRVLPDNNDFLLEKIYSSLLQGSDLELSLEQATRMLEASPNDDVRKLVCALGHWRLGDIESAVAACQGISLKTIDPINLGQTAVFAMIVVDAGPERVTQGNRTDFRTALTSILVPLQSSPGMLPEEEELRNRAARVLAEFNAQAAR
jgi:tetratricopeptide (TPR) repeat protein